MESLDSKPSTSADHNPFTGTPRDGQFPFLWDPAISVIPCPVVMGYMTDEVLPSKKKFDEKWPCRSSAARPVTETLASTVTFGMVAMHPQRSEGEVHEVHVCTRSLLCAALLGLCSWHVPDSLSLWTSSKPSEGDLSKLETPSVDKLSRPLSGQRRQRMPVSPMKKRGCLLGYSGD